MEKSLKQLIKEGEGNSLDFKKTITHLDKIARTMVSFANNTGGKILVGVRDDGKVIGVSAEEEKYMLSEAALHYCDPPLPLEFEEIEDEDEVTVLIVSIGESKIKPHKAKDNQGEWHVYIRANDQSIRASESIAAVLEKETIEREAARPKLFTNNELSLIDYLRRRQKITLKDYAKLVNIPKSRASKILSDLVVAGKLMQHAKQHTEFYTLRH
jgi:predicted HTH transcriptional regulator